LRRDEPAAVKAATMIHRNQVCQSHGYAKTDVISPGIEISPPDIGTRRVITGDGMAAESLQCTRQGRIKYRFHAPLHLLVAYERGERRDGETFVEGLPPSKLRNLARKLTLVPAGHEYHEWHEPVGCTHLIHFYFDPAKLNIYSKIGIADVSFTPRLFFEDTAVWLTVLKLMSLVESQTSGDRLYFEALGALLVCELIRLNRGMPSVQPQVRGGLAAWQQRIVTTFIEEHIADRIPLPVLAQLVHLSQYHFCREFKQSFGMPPHRYQTNRRIEQAKLLLTKPAVSMTDVGLTVGFSSSNEFSKVFRKVTGFTPRAYHRPWRHAEHSGEPAQSQPWLPSTMIRGKFMNHFDSYRENFPNARLARSLSGVLEVALHTSGGTLVFDGYTHEQFVELFQAIGSDRDNRVVILTGSGEAFMESISPEGFDFFSPQGYDKIYRDGKKVLMNILDIEVPIIAAVNGPVRVHAEYILLANIVLATPSTVFQDKPHFDIGVVPGDGVNLLWSEVIGSVRGHYFILTRQELSAETAKEWGAVNEIVPANKLLTRARELAEQLTKLPPLTLSYTRTALTQKLRRIIGEGVGYGLVLEGISAADLTHSQGTLRRGVT
jgi:enoyl-CoA hydratase/carnithine racemase/AraC-like DNA-binding protein